MAKSKKSEIIIKDIFVSSVIVAHKSTERLLPFVDKLGGLLRNHYTNYEIIVVDNGVSDEEIISLSEALDKLPCVRVIRLAQIFKYDTALFAGLDVAIGDYVCTLDPSLDPIATVPEIITRNQTTDVVQGVSKLPLAVSWVSRAGRRLFYWYNRKYIGIDINPNATYFAAYSRKAVNALTQTTRSQHHIRHLARRVGYSYVAFPYAPLKNPTTDRKLQRSMLEALEISISYSTHPLRFVTWLGLIASAVNAGYAVYVIAINISQQKVAEGWTTTSLQLALMFFILFIITVIIAEYIGRILTESYKDPQYYVADEMTSTVSLADAKKRNVTE